MYTIYTANTPNKLLCEGGILATQILESIGARVLETATAVAELARRRPRKTALHPLSAKRGFRRACDGSTKFRACHVSIRT